MDMGVLPLRAWVSIIPEDRTAACRTRRRSRAERTLRCGPHTGIINDQIGPDGAGQSLRQGTGSDPLPARTWRHAKRKECMTDGDSLQEDRDEAAAAWGRDPKL